MPNQRQKKRHQMIQQMQPGGPMNNNVPKNQMPQMGMNPYYNMNSQRPNIAPVNSMPSMYQANPINPMNQNNPIMPMASNMNQFSNPIAMNSGQFPFPNQMNVPPNILPPTQSKSKKNKDQARNSNQQNPPVPRQGKKRGPKPKPKVASVPSLQSLPSQPQPIIQPLPLPSQLPPSIQTISSQSQLQPPIQSMPSQSQLQPPVQSMQSQAQIQPPIQTMPSQSQLAAQIQSMPSQSQLQQAVQSMPSQSQLTAPIQSMPSQLQPPVQSMSSQSQLPPSIQHPSQSIPQPSIPIQTAQTVPFQSSISIPQSSQQITDSNTSEFNQINSATLQSIQSQMANSNFPFQNQQFSVPSDKTLLKEAILQMPEEKQEIFHRLFENASKRNKDDRNDTFIEQIYPTLLHSNSNAFNYLLSLINFLNEGTINVKNPPFPMIFRRIKGRKPIYKFVALKKKGFDIQPNFKDKQSDFGIIASFLCFTESIEPVPIVVGKEDVLPVQFGTKDYYYPIFLGENTPSKIHISFGFQSFPFLTFFIIRYVELRNVADTLHNLMTKAGIPIGEQAPLSLSQAPSVTSLQSLSSISNMPSSAQDQSIYAKTPTCNDDCSFQVLKTIEEIMKNGKAECPNCKSPIVLSELILEVRHEEIGEKEIEIPEETPERKLAMETLSVCLCNQLVPHPVDPKWEDMHYGDCLVKINEDAQLMQYKTTEEYLGEIEDIS